ncbi:hypothetical protein CYMTET_31129, partial [Cymbomonas tetramitiformis]
LTRRPPTRRVNSTRTPAGAVPDDTHQRSLAKRPGIRGAMAAAAAEAAMKKIEVLLELDECKASGHVAVKETKDHSKGPQKSSKEEMSCEIKWWDRLSGQQPATARRASSIATSNTMHQVMKKNARVVLVEPQEESITPAEPLEA